MLTADPRRHVSPPPLCVVVVVQLLNTWRFWFWVWFWWPRPPTRRPSVRHSPCPRRQRWDLLLFSRARASANPAGANPSSHTLHSSEVGFPPPRELEGEDVGEGEDAVATKVALPHRLLAKGIRDDGKLRTTTTAPTIPKMVVVVAVPPA